MSILSTFKLGDLLRGIGNIFANIITANVDPVLKKELGLFGYGEDKVSNDYKRNEIENEIIGVKDSLFIWQTDDGIDNSTDDADNSGMELDTFDTTTRSDSAQIKIENTSGGNETVRGAVIRGKPIVRLSGKQGIIHDDFVDYEDIYRNGEKKYELGNNYICTKTQVESLADWHWKNNRAKRHLYLVSMTGTRYWFSPGEWYTLTLGEDGTEEYIDSVVECYSVQIERGVGEMGITIVAFREVYENWTKDSNALARIIAGGNPYNMPDFGRRLVASSTYIGKADYYCDGTSDEDEINAAVAELAGVGGGFVELTEGIYYTDSTIVLADDIVLIGKGWDTIIEKEGNFHGIDLTGGSGSEYSNVSIRDFKIQRGDTDYGKNLVYFEYVDDVTVQNVWFYNSGFHGLYLKYCDRPYINNCKATACDNVGLGLTADELTSAYARFVGNSSNSNGYGIAVEYCNHSTISSNVCSSNTEDGIYVGGANCSITGNVCENNGDDGIIIAGCVDSVVSGNVCEGNTGDGIQIGNTCVHIVVTGNRATSNSEENFDDDGAATTDSGNDWN